MEALAETPIAELGSTRIIADAPPGQLREGRGDVLRMEPETGDPLVWTAVSEPREAIALQVLFRMLDQRDNEIARQFREDVEDEVGHEVAWPALTTRFDKAAAAF